MIAGTLEVQMLANLARLQQDMTQAKNMVGGAMKSIEASVAQAKAMLAGLGITLGVGYFVSLIKGSIDAMDHLNDLSKTTKLTVETLAGLRMAAKQSGGDLDSIAQSINKLSVNMGKEPEKFRALGISAKDPLEAFKQLADIFVKTEDLQQRNAVAAAALGKQWQGAGPLLAEGGKKIGELVEKGAKLSGINKQMTEQADALNDKWVELFGSGKLLVTTVGSLLPLLNYLADGMISNRDAAKDLKTEFSPLLEILKVILVIGANVKYVFETIGKELAKWKENMMLLGKGDFAGIREMHRLFRADFEASRKELDEFEKKVMGFGKPGSITPSVVEDTLKNKKDADDQAARNAAFLGTNKDRDAALKALQTLEDAYVKTRLDALKESSANSIAILDAEHAQNLIGERDYWTQRADLQRQAYVAERIDIEGQIKRQIEYRNTQIAGSKDYIEATKDAMESVAKLNKLNRDFVQSQQMNSIAARQAMKQYQDSVEALNIRLMTLKGLTVEAAAAQAALSNRDTREKAVGRSDTATIQKLNEEEALLKMQAQLKDVMEQRADINARAAIAEQMLQDTRRTGAISELELMQRTEVVRKQQYADLSKTNDVLQDIRATAIDPKVKLQIDQETAEMERLRMSTELTAEKFNTIFSDSFSSAFADFVSGTKSASEAFKSFANTVVLEINKMVAQDIWKQLFGGGTGTGASGGIFGTGGIGGWLAWLLGSGAGAGAAGAAGNAAGTAGITAGAIAGSYIPFGAANGADWMVGGSGGTDSRIAQFKVTPGERIIVQTPEQQGKGGGSMVNHFTFAVSGPIDRRTQSQISAAAGEGVRVAMARQN